jgi:RHS repeat-associated protein
VHRDYDTAGRLAAITLPTGLISYAYSPTTGKLVGLSGPDGETLSFGFDGRLLTDVGYAGPVAGAVHWTYNNDFRVSQETVNGGSTAVFSYDNDGLLTQAGSQTLARNKDTGLLAGTTLGSVTDSYSYDPYGAVQTYSAKYGATTLLSESYTRDALGRIATKTETVQGTPHTYGYTYDLVGRLTDVTVDGATSAHYSYDPNGNRIAKTAGATTLVGIADNQDRLLSYGAASYTYGANGELASKTAAGQTTNFTYDALGNLKRVAPPTGPIVDYLVDGQGRRIAKKVNDVLVKGYIWMDALRVAAEFDGAGNLVSRFVYGTRGNVPEYMVRGADTYRLVTDHLGSVRLVVNTATGNVVQRIDYDEFGVVANDNNPGFQPFGFAGGLYDADTKLVRFGARDYDAETGRWTAKDPIGFEGQQANIYAYAGNDPVDRADRNGLYGTNDCSYYDQRCREVGGKYYCEQAPWWCNHFPKPPDPDPSRDDDYEGWPRCVRQCLQDCDRKDSKDQNSCPAKEDDRPGPWSVGGPSYECHKSCYVACWVWGTFLPNSRIGSGGTGAAP